MATFFSSSGSLASSNLSISLFLIVIVSSALSLFTVSAYPITQPYYSSYQYHQLPPGVTGPESLDFDCNGEGPYTSVSDGRIFKWERRGGFWREFAYTGQYRVRALCDGNRYPALERICGRPLGIKFNKQTCDLYIADAYFGIVRVGRNGGAATRLVSSAEGVPFKFTNNLDIHPDTGVLYFTDSSTRFTRMDHLRVTSSGDSTGRLMKYDPQTGEVTVLQSRLKFANGVVLSKNNDYILVAETGANRVMRHWLSGPRATMTEFFSQVPGAPDNIKRNAAGEFWVALNNGRSTPSFNSGETIGVRLDEEGRIVEALHGNGLLESVTELEEKNGMFWVGSNVVPFVSTFTV